MSLALAPLSLVFGALTRARTRLYRSGVFKTERVGAPVISVGNLTVGGTGKTPLVEWVARAVANEGLRPCVLTRGYGREDVRSRVVVSDGARVRASVREGGDEAVLLAEALSGVASVVSDRDRVGAARWARGALGARVFVLDDGFQHMRIARDLDIVTLDATAPWGGGHLLPWGRLREPVTALARADCVVVTRSDLSPDLGRLRSQIERLTAARVVVSRVRTRGLRRIGDDTQESAARVGVGGLASSGPVAAFCAVGNPRAFFGQLRKEGFDLRHTRPFPDHHDYTRAEVETLTREAERAGARALLTTAKDAVKLRSQAFSLPCYVVEIELEFDDEDSLRGLLKGAISKDGSNRAEGEG
ncbi:MAG TPA: tetraacyldisaccharide 4'-kinase [Pyrinomonadaceae bacterium]|jgi:tetraacyldisaccharide 4'-kinase|nr:tetraacyldisaccharide 4'-kinase [Pyrinomonadaceae bacterium]